jgi:RNA polymerase sigma-70 factor (sigma-E family)
VTALVHGEVDAVRSLERLFRAYHAPLLRLAYVFTGNGAVAEDLVQDAFVRLHRSRSWPQPGSELAYLRRTVVNLSHGHHRHLRVVRRHDERTAAERDASTPGPEDELSSRDRQQLIARAVRRLPPRQRDCVVLHYFGDLSDAEIARDLGISEGSVKTHLHRARHALAEQLEHMR